MTRVNKSVSFDNSTVTEIENFQRAAGIEDFSEANEQLVLKGLKK